jgi:CubicO group peptidase (beta-lactamase class C family)
MMRFAAALLVTCTACAATVHPVPAGPSTSTPAASTGSRGTAAGAPNFARGIATADSMIAASVGRLYPGAVFLVSRHGAIVHDTAFGYAQLNDYEGRRLASPPPMTRGTMFDLASVTKVMGTTMGIMRLVDQGRVALAAPVYRYLPDFRDAHKDSITVRHLLSHSAGLVQWQPLYYHASNEREAYDVIRDMPLQWGVGEGRHYSDLSFMLLGYIAERVSGQRLDVFLDSAIYRPLGLDSITFVPRRHGFTRFAATEQGNVYERHMVYDSTFGYRYLGDPTAWNGWRLYVLDGEVDDGNSFYAHGGIAGHAGLFATAGQLRVLMDMLVSGGAARTRLLSTSVVNRFLTRDRYDNYLGWMRSPSLPEGSFYHTGFTGTYVLGVPKYGLSVILLTNRQNMGTDARGYFPNLAPLQEAVAKSLIAGAEADAH